MSAVPAAATSAAAIAGLASGTSVDRRQQWRAMLGVYSTMMLLGLETTVTGMVLPSAVRQLDGLSHYAMLGTISTVATAVTILFAARLGDGIGRRALLLLSVVLLVSSNVLSGLAPGIGVLVTARGLAGIACGMVTAAAVTAPADVFHDPAERIRWQSWSSVVFAIASSVGPLVGGAIIDSWGWRAGFMILPMAGLLSLALLSRYPRLAVERSLRQPMDWRGGLLLAFASGAPLVALSLAAGQAAGLQLAVLLMLLSTAAACVYVAHQRRVAQPFLPLRVLASAESRLLVFGALVTGAVMFVLLFYGPLLLQAVLGLTPARAGLLIMPMMLALPVGSVLNGQLFRRLARPERLLVAGLLLLCCGCACLLAVVLGFDRSTALIVSGFSLAGLGLGMAQPAQSVFMQMRVERRDLGVATGLVSMSRSVGSGLGAALIGVAIARTATDAGLAMGLGILLLCCLAVAGATARCLDTTAPQFHRH